MLHENDGHIKINNNVKKTQQIMNKIFQIQIIEKCYLMFVQLRE